MMWNFRVLFIRLSGDVSCVWWQTGAIFSNDCEHVVMDVIKMEPEVDPLAIESNVDSVTEEADVSPDQVRGVEGMDPIYDVKWGMKNEESALSIACPVVKCESEQVTGVESVDSIYDVKWGMKSEEPTLSNVFPVVKCESEKETFDVDIVKEEMKVEEMSEDYEELTERTLNTDGNEMPQMICTSPENCVSSENCQVTRVESADSIYKLKWEMKSQEPTLSIAFPVVKCESEHFEQ
ncbi:uncharacterized protein [Periplaneta americana]|uniref:uncharacterized protein isoform X5 n=1 Tax=Periplaneta americana TaxID=6978 RepID=UPI0037E71920